MKRKDFLHLSALSMGAMFLPKFSLLGNEIDPLQALNEGMDVKIKKEFADVALNAAKSKGATYADVRIGRYLNQFVATREKRVQGVANTESFGIGIRVIANGCWGFAATNNVTKDAIAKAAEQAVAVAKANAKIQGEAVRLAPQKGFGEVSWKAPVEVNAFSVPVKEKVDLLLQVNDAAMKNGANFVNSVIFAVNEQKYFASTDGSYIDQDIQRIYPNFNVTRIDRASGKFMSRRSLSSPM
ncbi:PmbA/TldA family metallopeptidase, partial [Flavitalea antarctica]